MAASGRSGLRSCASNLSMREMLAVGDGVGGTLTAGSGDSGKSSTLTVRGDEGSDSADEAAPATAGLSARGSSSPLRYSSRMEVSPPPDCDKLVTGDGRMALTSNGIWSSC